MQQHQKNKEFIINYFNAFSQAGGAPKNRAFLERFMTDEALISHIDFFEAAFPGYEVFCDEMTAEDDRVVVQAHMKGTHSGFLGDIPPTGKSVDFPFIIRYQIENNKIVHHWMMADQMELMRQLGVVPAAAEAAH